MRELAPTPIIEESTITAANLLRRVKQEILAEPKRLNMHGWLFGFRKQSDFAGCYGQRKAPACGTVACISGWCAVLTRRAQEGSPDRASFFPLGRLSESSLFELYTAGRSPLDGRISQERFDREFGLPGTRKHARFVAKRIDRFLKKHPELETRIIHVR